MRDTTSFEKLLPSTLNAGLVFLLASPFVFAYGLTPEVRVGVVALFFLLQLLDTNTRGHFRCFGMRIFGTHWAKTYSNAQKILYSILYTLSLSTLLFYISFPFDIFLLNMLFLQLPCILLTGTTLHGYLSGNMRTVVKK
jgi:hypothetical protein